jgi:hypothetical protein
LKPFLDKWHLIPGEPWQEALEEALDQSRTCAVFLGPGGLGPWENEEMRAALDERVRNKSFRVIPVLLPGAEPKDKKTLPRFLSRLIWVDFRGGLDDPETFRRLVAGIRGLPPGRQPAFTQQEDQRIFNLPSSVAGSPPIKRNQRRIDAAVPNNCEVGRTIDLLVQARFSDSPQLGSWQRFGSKFATSLI